MLIWALAAAAGCASAPSYRTNSEFLRRSGGIRTVGLLPPVVSMSEERARFGMNDLVPQAAWSSAAADVVSRVFAEEMAAGCVSLVAIGTEDPEAKELDELYNAVDFSVRRHAWEKRSDEFVPLEPFPEKVRAFDWSLGPAGEFMERNGVDAIWIVRGYNLLPTTGARVKEGVEFILGVLAAAGGHGGGPTLTYRRIELRAALVDRAGSVLYYGVADERAGFPTEERPREPAAAGDPPGPGPMEDRASLTVDLRDPRVARHYIKAALAGYRAKGSP